MKKDQWPRNLVHNTPKHRHVYAHSQLKNRQHEHARAELRTSFDQNRAQMIRYLGEDFEEKLQWEENEYHYHLTSEEQQYDNLVADLEDRNAELIAEVNSLRSILTTGQNSPPQGGALPVNVVDVGESSAKQPSPPQGGASASGVQGLGSPLGSYFA